MLRIRKVAPTTDHRVRLTLTNPAGRRDQEVDFDALAIDGITAARLGAVSSPTRPRTGRRAVELPTGR
jgi:hypothetical protein